MTFRIMSSGMLRGAVLWKFTYISKVLTAVMVKAVSTVSTRMHSNIPEDTTLAALRTWNHTYVMQYNK
jgi:hypothetical protein